ncbi:MAG TPA: bifunctional adenosylcobinamide kinase/adenosylcobinamide-phosphate guanylyltransferase [Anaerolineales bacterium]|nr:bifunctional adenosylcobinamide kinase/adenosylcobinamide-phosphate guanylyltransferase [Anaerolineales bacterium]HRF48974.1 bifunctional adenosylcobinamide kinase/adenosylcobinamide-phosphate guanylyltransferase [Anaerolineales bacterium]
MLTFILGGARSGKSSYAERLATEHGGPVLYVATARAWDSDMAARIRRHQADRPAHWRTLEAPLGVGAAVTDWLAAANEKPAVILLDCLTLLANNVIAPLPEDLRPEVAEEALAPEIAALTECIAASGIDWIVVSNEVGLGIVPPYALGRAYRDALGRANQRMAAVADRVLFMVAGLPLTVK